MSANQQPYLVRDIMSTDLKTLPFFATMTAALEMMDLHCIRHILITDIQDELVGIISDRDLRQDLLLEDNFGQGKGGPQRIEVGEVMTEFPATISADSMIHQVAELFREYSINALPVLENGKVVGIVTSTDLLNVIAQGKMHEREAS